jgi:hypothetical protein
MLLLWGQVQPIRHFIDRLDEHEIEMKTSPSIVPSRDEGWLRRLLAARLR